MIKFRAHKPYISKEIDVNTDRVSAVSVIKNRRRK